MPSRMPRSLWAVLLAAYALLAFAAYVFAGVQVAPCLGGVGPEGLEMQRRCAEQWFESRPIWDKLLNSPFLAVVVFVALVLLTAWLTRVREPRPGRAVQGRSI